MKNIYSIFLLLISLSAFSQWNPSPAINNPACVLTYDQVNVKIAPDLKGGTILVWEDYRNDATQIAGDIFAQRINSDGNVVWQTNGIAICTDAAHQSSPSIVTDSSGGAIIVWQDHRSPKRNLYAQRIDSSGNVLWAANGIGVTIRNFDQKNAKLLTDGNHGAIVLWQDSVGGAYDIYGQRLDNTGTALWPNGVGICTNALSQVNVKGQINAAGDIYVTWQDKRNGTDYDIYAQKLNLAGAPQWTTNGVSICSVAGGQSNPKIVLDAGGSAIIAWQDKRNGTDYDVFAQRVNSAGAVQWSANGVAITNVGGTQSAIDLTAQNISNGAIIAWKDTRLGSTNVDIYAQLINLSGAVQWAANGVVVANGTANQLAPNVSPDGSGGAVIAYQDSSSGSWDIKSQRVSGTGSLMWTAGGIGVGTAASDQVNHSNMLVTNGGTIYAFQDLRSGNNDIYAYKLDQNGLAVNVTQLTGVVEKVEVYPNPSNDKVFFRINDLSYRSVLEIKDVNGKMICTHPIEPGNTFELDKKLPAGIYFYSIHSENFMLNGKFVITY